MYNHIHVETCSVDISSGNLCIYIYIDKYLYCIYIVNPIVYGSTYVYIYICMYVYIYIYMVLYYMEETCSENPSATAQHSSHLPNSSSNFRCSQGSGLPPALRRSKLEMLLLTWGRLRMVVFSGHQKE